MNTPVIFVYDQCGIQNKCDSADYCSVRMPLRWLNNTVVVISSIHGAITTSKIDNCILQQGAILPLKAKDLRRVKMYGVLSPK